METGKCENNSIFRLHGELYCFSAGYEEDREHLERLEDEKGREMLNLSGTWFTKRVLAAQQKHLERTKITINPYKSGWKSRLIELKRKLAAAFGETALFSDGQ